MKGRPARPRWGRGIQLRHLSNLQRANGQHGKAPNPAQLDSPPPCSERHSLHFTGDIMRIAIAGFMHESITFSRNLTDRAAFEAASLTFGDDVIAEWRDAHHEMAGFIEGAARFGYELAPIVMASATPAGPVTDDMLHEIVD